MANKEKSEDEKQNAASHAKTAHKQASAHTAKQKPHDREKEKLKEAVKEYEEKNKELQDKYLRLSAEFDNYRKRTLREKTEMVKTASEDLLIRFIPFLDDIERGIVAMNQVKDQDAVREGMNLIYARFREFLQLNGIKEMEALNQDFDMDLHEAVTKIPVQDEEMKGRIVDVIEKGYLLHDKVIRYPKVVIGE
jgi:molecular chaperone GrpE